MEGYIVVQIVELCLAQITALVLIQLDGRAQAERRQRAEKLTIAFSLLLLIALAMQIMLKP